MMGEQCILDILIKGVEGWVIPKYIPYEMIGSASVHTGSIIHTGIIGMKYLHWGLCIRAINLQVLWIVLIFTVRASITRYPGHSMYEIYLVPDPLAALELSQSFVHSAVT